MKRWALVALAVSSLSACSDEAPELLPYSGPAAYPNRRVSYANAAERLGYVSNSLSDSISLLDMDSLSVIAELPVGRDPVDIDGPHHLAIDAERGQLYVALSYPPPSVSPGPHAGHGGSERLGYVQALALDDLRPLGEVRVEQNPGDIVLAPDRSSLAVTHYDLVRAQRETALDARRAALILLDPAPPSGAAPSVRHRVSVCIAPHGALYTRDSARVLIACAGEDSLVVVDVAQGSVLARVPVAERIGSAGSPLHEPYAAVLDPAGRRLAVSNIRSRSVVLFDVDEEVTRTSTTALLGAGYFAAWTPDGARVIVPHQAPDGAALLDGATGELLEQVSYRAGECQAPHEAVITEDGRVFLVCEGDHRAAGAIVELDPETLEIRARVEVSVFPDRLGVLEP